MMKRTPPALRGQIVHNSKEPANCSSRMLKLGHSQQRVMAQAVLHDDHDATLLQEIPTHLRDRRFTSLQDRRQFLRTLGLGGLFFTTQGAFAQALTLTPKHTVGPYCPDHLPTFKANRSTARMAC